MTPAELSKDGGKYLKTLIALIDKEEPTPLPIDPAFRAKFADDVAYIDPGEIPLLQTALSSDNISAALPKKLKMIIGGEETMQPPGILFKGKEFTGLEGKKSYNAGHLAELFMGLSVSAKFFNVGNPITTEQLYDMIGHIESAIEGKNYVFTIERSIAYPDSRSKTDSLSFLARVPARSAEAFLEQAKNRKFEGDLGAIFSSAVKYVNESESVADSCKKVKQDKNNNKIDVISDGTTDAKGTKADITLLIDGSKINLLSLKTYGSDTLGQFSGLSIANLTKWFRINFNLDISPYLDRFDPSQSEDNLYKNLLDFYDEIVHPFVVEHVKDQTPGREAKIVEHLAHAANIYARGESLEDVEIVKLDDKVPTGSYKILKFSHSLKEAMTHLDLDVRYVNGGQSRTIQIWVKPQEGEKVIKGANRLCQFRTTKTGGYTRNYFESGPMLELLTAVKSNTDATVTPKDKTALSKTSTTRELK